MKKFLFAVAMLALIGLVSSCSKTKVCHCTYTVNVLGYEQTSSTDKVIESGSCSDLEKDAATWEIPGLTTGSVHCEKK